MVLFLLFPTLHLNADFVGRIPRASRSAWGAAVDRESRGTKDCGRTGVILSSTGRRHGGYGGLVLMWCGAVQDAQHGSTGGACVLLDGGSKLQLQLLLEASRLSLTMTDCLIFVRSDNDLFLTLRMAFAGMGLFGVDETSPVSEWNRRGHEGTPGRALAGDGRARQRAGEGSTRAFGTEVRRSTEAGWPEHRREMSRV